MTWCRSISKQSCSYALIVTLGCGTITIHGTVPMLNLQNNVGFLLPRTLSFVDEWSPCGDIYPWHPVIRANFYEGLSGVTQFVHAVIEYDDELVSAHLGASGRARDTVPCGVIDKTGLHTPLSDWHSLNFYLALTNASFTNSNSIYYTTVCLYFSVTIRLEHIVKWMLYQWQKRLKVW